jgi:uncharacterized membrane protein YfcA
MTPEMALFGIAFTCLIAAAVNAAFATGGIFILIAVTTSILPISVAVPLLPLFAFGSLLGRCIFFRHHIQWPIAWVFSLGSLLGAALGVRVFMELSDDFIGVLLGGLLLVMIWFPNVKFTPRWRHPFFVVGIAHAFVSSLVGAGSVLQAIIIRTKLSKLEITATLAMCTAIMEVFKVSGYLLTGFQYGEYMFHIVVALVAGIVGTWVGGRLAHKVSERHFRPIFKLIISIVAVKLLAQVWL